VHPQIIVVAAAVVNQEYCPGIMRDLERQLPHLICSTVNANESELRHKLLHGEGTIAIAPQDSVWPGFDRTLLLEVRPRLVYPSALRLNRREFWGRGTIPDKLYHSASTESLMVSVDRGLRNLGVKWPNRRCVASIAAVLEAVALGDGFGITVDVPPFYQHKGVRSMVLDFDSVPISAYSPHKKTPGVDEAIKAMQQLAQQIEASRRH
jgi:DNA-binding transcriptional LysR family regulator